MNKQWKRWLCMLAVVLAAALGVLPARAGVTSGSLRVTLTDRQGRPAGDVVLVLYPVAGTNGVLTADFSGAGIPADSLLSQQDAAANARLLADWAADRSPAGTEAVTDSRGRADFAPLGLGIYLVTCRPGQSVTFAPFLISIPLTENGRPLYDVAAYPKTEKPDSPDHPGTPDKPDGPDTPDDPDEPDMPDMPDTPDSPNTPDSPDKPSMPQTGTDPLPACALLTGGGVLVLLGLADLLRQRRHAHDETE